MTAKMNREVLAMLRVAFEFGRSGGGGRVAPQEWQQMLRATRDMRKAVAFCVSRVLSDEDLTQMAAMELASRSTLSPRHHTYIENNPGIDCCATCGNSRHSREHRSAR